MSYPQVSNFTIAAPDGFNMPAWWTYTRDNGAVNVCSTTGASFMRQLQAVLAMTSSSGLKPALLNQARALQAAFPSGGWNVLVDTITLAAQPDVNTMRFAIWLAYYHAHPGLRLDAINLPAGTILPTWEQSIPGDANAPLVCFDPSRDVNTNVLGTNDFAAAVASSQAGVRLHPGETLPTASSAPPAGPGGIPGWAVALFGVVAVGVVAVVAKSNQSAAERKYTGSTKGR